MCLALPAKVIEAPDPLTGIGRVDAGGVRWQVHLGLLDEVAVGDWVLVHMGIAVRKDHDVAGRNRDVLRARAADHGPALGDQVVANQPFRSR